MRSDILEFEIEFKEKLIVIFILITTVPLSITTIITSYVSYTTIVKDAFQNNSTISKSLARELNLMLDAKIKTLNIMSKNPELQSMDTSRQLTVLPAYSQSVYGYDFRCCCKCSGNTNGTHRRVIWQKLMTGNTLRRL